MLRKLKSRVSRRCVKTKAVGSSGIKAANPEALRAIHEFLKLRTGDRKTAARAK